MTVAYVLRHPQTSWNAAGCYQGRLEAPLSAEGRRQSRLTASAMADRAPDIVYTSPLRRALDLAQNIAGTLRLPLVVDQRLTEIAIGPWEGLYHSQIEERFPVMLREWYERPDRVRFPHGESAADVQLRALSVLADLYAAHPEENICIVTHSAIIQVLTAAALGLDLRNLHRIHVANGGITTFSGDSAPGLLVSFNVTDQLFERRRLDDTADVSTSSAQRMAS
jgi:probable phosphoglycerate mutase